MGAANFTVRRTVEPHATQPTVHAVLDASNRPHISVHLLPTNCHPFLLTVRKLCQRRQVEYYLRLQKVLKGLHLATTLRSMTHPLIHVACY